MKFRKKPVVIEFEKELKSLINRHSREVVSNTPDFILAEYLQHCLDAWNTAAQQRETWYGIYSRPSDTVKVLEGK